MTTELACRGCGRALPTHHAPFIGNAEYNVWAREGYCSYFCFRQKGPPELLQLDEEIEARREQAVSAIDGDSRRAESRRNDASNGEPVPPSVWLRIAARLLDTALAIAVLLGIASALGGWIEAEATRASGDPAAAARFLQEWKWLLERTITAPWADARFVVLLIGGSSVAFALLEWIAGTTPVKLLFGLGVRREDGGRAGPLALLLREVIFYFDAVFLGIVAFACMAIGEQRQRLGDFAAHTVVRRLGPERWRPLSILLLLVATVVSLAAWVGLGFAF